MGNGVSIYKKSNTELKKITKQYYYNRAFSLIKKNEDLRINRFEIELFAYFFHQYNLELIKKSYNELRKKDSVKYLYDILGKSYGIPINKKEFLVLCKKMPQEKFYDIIEILEKRNIE